MVSTNTVVKTNTAGMADADCCARVPTPLNGDIRYNCAVVLPPLNCNIRCNRGGRCCLAYSVAQTLLCLETRHETLSVMLCCVVQTLLSVETRASDAECPCCALLLRHYSVETATLER